jgi:hypothetical protein
LIAGTCARIGKRSRRYSVAYARLTGLNRGAGNRRTGLDSARNIKHRLRLARADVDADALMAVVVIIDIHNSRAVRTEGREVTRAVEPLRRGLREGVR